MANEFKIKKGLIVNGSGSTILDIQGSQGQLFSVTDQLSGSLFSVNDISGIPIMEVFSDNTVNLGTFNAEAIKVSGSFATMTGSLFGTASWANNATTASFATNALTSSLTTTAVTGSNVLVTTSSTSNTFKVPFINHTGNTTGVYGLLQDSESAIFTYNPSTNILAVPTINSTIANRTGDGLATAPGFGFINSTQTGIYLPSSNVMGFTTAGTERMRIDTSGNIGINTAAPSSRLHIQSGRVLVQDAPITTGVIRPSFSDIQNSNELLRLYTVSGQGNGYISNPNGPLYLGASAQTGSIVINTNGNVGIGTTTPATRLDINSTSSETVARLNSTGGSELRLSSLTFSRIATWNGTDLVFATNRDERMRILSTGNVGIGTTNPQTPLDIVHSNNSFGSTIRLENTNTGASAITSIGFVQASSGGTRNASLNLFTDGTLDLLTTNGSIWFRTSNTSSMFIDTSQRVGIGTQSPTSRLHVSGSALFENGVFVVDVTNNELIIDGNVGIQTPGSPENWVHIQTEPSTGKRLRIDALQDKTSPLTYTPGSGNTVNEIIGNVVNDNVLGEPDYWMEIELNSNGNIVFIPCYLP